MLIFPQPPQTAPPAGTQVFKYMSLWGTFSIKPAQIEKEKGKQGEGEEWRKGGSPTSAEISIRDLKNFPRTWSPTAHQARAMGQAHSVAFRGCFQGGCRVPLLLCPRGPPRHRPPQNLALILCVCVCVLSNKQI